MDAMERKGDEAGHAVAAVDRAMTGLVKLLKSADESVRREALAELLKIGPFALGHMIRILLDMKDRALRLRIIDALAEFAPTAREPVSLALAAIIQHGTDPDARQAAYAVTFAMISRLGLSPAPHDPAARSATERTGRPPAEGHRRRCEGAGDPISAAVPPSRSPDPSPPGQRDSDGPATG